VLLLFWGPAITLVSFPHYSHRILLHQIPADICDPMEDKNNALEVSNNFTIVKGRPHIHINVGFKIEFGKPRWKNFGFDMCLNSRIWVSRLVPLFWGLNLFVSNSNGKRSFKPYKSAVMDWSRKWMILPNKRGTNLENKLLEVRHMSRLKFFYKVYLTLFQDRHFWAYVAFPWAETWVQQLPTEDKCSHCLL
jgi:hypothetical protein